MKVPDVLLDTTSLKYRVFFHVHSLGQGYLTSGMKFGGDYLYYPGDPLLYHANTIFHISKTIKEFSLNEFQAMGRLGATVKKRQIIACEQEDRIVYYTLERKDELWQPILIGNLSLIL